MLNKLSYNLANSLNESESEVLKISKKVLIESDRVKTIIKKSKTLTEADGWIAFYNGKKVEITKDEADDLWGAKQVAIKKLNVPKSKTSQLAVEPAYNESEELKEDLTEDSFVSLEDTEGFDEATLVQGRAILFMGETAEELGVSEEEALNRQAQEYNVKIISTKPNSDGSIEVTAEGTPSNILLFFSQGDCDNSYDFKMSYELEVKNVESLGEAEELKEEYSDKLGGDPADFVSDVESIRAMLQVIDTTQFGTRLAQQIVEDWIEACNRQIEKGKRLASGDEFYTESEGCSKQKIEETTVSEVERVHETIENAETEAEVKEAILSISDNRLESEVLSAFNQCIQDEDDLDALKDHVLVTLEDNATYNESEELTEEVEVKNLQVIKEQGNVYMLEDENKKMIVGENYNADEGIIENAEIYENKEEADKDYLSRCDIIKDGEEFKSEEPTKEVMDEGIIDDLKLNHRVKKADKASERYDADKSKRNKKRMNKAFNKLDAEKERQIKKHQDKINKIKKA